MMADIRLGQIVPRTFTVGYIILSYVVSYVGALTTLELLHRRTADTGLYNWYLLVGSAVTMGAIAIWSMHFVGNRAIVLLNGDLQMQIAYSSGATALSFFVPIFVLLAAFLAVGANDKVSRIRVAIGGTLAGLAICGMHYLGQAGIANYGCVYSIPHVAGSAVIAVIASITALSIFFVFRAAWTNSAWKRALCAIVLAGAVSGMHWLASVGTQYRFRGDISLKQNISRDQTVIIVIALSMGACAILLAFAILAKRRRSKSASRAQQVILACATFDPEGRLLVTPEGMLPTEKITNSFEERSFDDIFSIAHPVFLWMFRTTRNWRGIAGLIPGMRRHLHAAAALNMMRHGTHTPSPNYASADDSDGAEDYSIVFRELFCVAAAGLAEQLNEPLDNLGVLYDQIVVTGTITGRGRGRKSRLLQLKSEAAIPDTERGSPTPLSFGPGKLLFVVRRANRAEASRLQASGFRFAAPPQVVDHLSRRMQVGRDEFVMHLDDMREYSGEEHMLEPGVHLACFAIRAGVRGGFDLIVRRDAKNLLPTMQLPIASIEPWHSEFLSQFNGWSVSACLRWLRTKSSVTSEKDKMFVAQFHSSLTALVEKVDEPFFQEALFVAKSVQAPCRGTGHNAAPAQATLLAFRHIVPIHFQPSNARLVFTPLSFFRCQQQVYKNLADHELFARKTHREIAPVLDHSRPSMHHDRQGSAQTNGRPTLTRKGSSLLSIFKSKKSPASIFRGDNSSKNNLVENQTLGGIMVSTEFSVAVGKGDTHVELTDLGTSGEATKEVEDPEIFVDVLIQACKGK